MMHLKINHQNVITYSTMHTLQFVEMRLKILKHTEIRMEEYMIENMRHGVLGVRVEQRLYRNAVRE